MRIGHNSLNVSDILRSVDFYQKILGFKIIGKSSGEKVLLAASGSSTYLVELLQAKKNSAKNDFGHKKRAGLYHFAILLPERLYLADILRKLRDNHSRVHFDGLADHLVSEAIYMRDPDSNGVEIYWDRPASEWRWDGKRLEMATLPLDTIDLLKEETNKGWKEMPPMTSIGHVHLHVSDLSKALKFYHDILGLNLTATYPGAYFFASGKYHHHIAVNTWLGTDIEPSLQQTPGLDHFSIDLSSKDEYAQLVRNLSKYSGKTSNLSDTSVFVRDSDRIRMQIRQI